MEITVSGRHMEVSDKLRDLTEQKLGRLERFLDMERAEVHFTKYRNPRIAESETCEVTLEGHGHHVRTKATGPDAFSAVDKAVVKLEQQLSRLKSKLIGRNRATARDRVPGAEPVAATSPAEGSATTEPHEPRIVKSKRFAMMPMTAEEAVDRMQLLGHGFFFFTNADTSRAAVVYARDDGDIGLIDEAG